MILWRSKKKMLLRRLLAKKHCDVQAGNGRTAGEEPGIRAGLQAQVKAAKTNIKRAKTNVETAMEARKEEVAQTALQVVEAREKIRAALKARKEELKNNIRSNSLRGRLPKR